MRYREIVEAESAAAKRAKSLWKATQKKHRAARKLQDTLRQVSDVTGTAKSSPPGPDRAKRVAAAAARQRAAKEQYGHTMKSADNSIRSTLAREGVVSRCFSPGDCVDLGR